MSDLCIHCGKGSNHWTDWDIAGADCNGNGRCKNPVEFSPAVGDWMCSFEKKDDDVSEQKTRKLVVELPESTFAYLEMLAFGLELESREHLSEDKQDMSDWDGFDKAKNDFAPAVRELLVSVANSVATGVARPGSWERGVVDSLTMWQGTYNKGMLAECIKEEVGGQSSHDSQNSSSKTAD